MTHHELFEQFNITMDLVFRDAKYNSENILNCIQILHSFK